MPRDFDGSVIEYEDLLIEQAKKRKINILLLGPGINTESAGAELRKYIASKCEGERNVIYGERDDLINAFKRVIGKYFDLCSYEFHLAKQVVDALIIIPDSAGSLVELGLFSLEDDIHPWTLVLFSSEHNPHNESDFISLGPKRSYDRVANVKTCDYSDKKLVWDIVDDFLEKMKAIKFSKKRMEL